MNKWKNIVEIALSEITDTDDLGDIAEMVIAKLRDWKCAEESYYKELAEKELEELTRLKSWLING